MHLQDAIQFQAQFFKHIKTTFLNCWVKSENQEFTKMFQELSDTPVEVNENRLKLLEEFVKDVYYPLRMTNRSLDDLRMENYLALADMHLRLLPPSKKGLHKHAQCGCVQGSWINRECRDNVLPQDPKVGKRPIMFSFLNGKIRSILK